MKIQKLLLCLLFVTAVTVQAAGINVALNKAVTLNGSFPLFTYGAAPGLCGVNPPQAAASTLDDGVFLAEGSCFQGGTIYWSSNTQADTIDIDLGGQFMISSAIVQADDNDSYTLQYRDTSGVYHDWWNIGPSGSFGTVTRPNSADQTQQQTLPAVVATGLRFFAPNGSGDGFYAVSEIEAFGVTATPEPASWGLLVGGLGCVFAGIWRRRRN